MREIRQRRNDTGRRRNLVDENTLASAIVLTGWPLRDAPGNAFDRAKNNLRGHTSADDKKRNPDSDPSRNTRRALHPGHGLRERHPEQRDEGGTIVKVNRPLGRTPGKKMLEQDRRGDQQPVRSEKGQAEEGDQQCPEQVAVAKGVPKSSRDSLG